MRIVNAVINSADITTGDRGALTASLDLNYGGSGQGFGGYALYLPKSATHHRIESVMEIAGVAQWSNVTGKAIRVRIGDNDLIDGIGHIVNDDWFFPKADFAAVDHSTEGKA